MKTFEEWVKENHSEYYSEDWRSFAKKGALAAGIGMAGLGIGNKMLGPSNVELIQKHFPTVAVNSLSPSEISHYAQAAKAIEKGQSASNQADRTIKSTDDFLHRVDKSAYKIKHGREPDGGFNQNVPNTHYQNPAFWQQNSGG